MDIFLEAFLHQFLPIYDEVTLPAMAAFGDDALTQPVALAALGAFAAALSLYGVGRLAAPMVTGRMGEETYARRAARLRFPLAVLLLVVASPVGFAILFAAGAFRVPPALALPAALLGIAAGYAMQYGAQLA